MVYIWVEQTVYLWYFKVQQGLGQDLPGEYARLIGFPSLYLETKLLVITCSEFEVIDQTCKNDATWNISKMFAHFSFMECSLLRFF